MVVDYSPWLEGRPVGVNVMEAMISAALSRTPEQLGADDFLDVIERLGVEPRILYPNGYRRINRFAFVIHPLSQQYLTKTPPLDWVASVSPPAVMNLVEKAIAYTPPFVYRSEEHTSELQSRPHLVCRLLLEKKKPKGIYSI